MIRKLMRSSVAVAGLAALLFVGACASTDDGRREEVRPFTERGYDPTRSAPELADANNDGITDSSTMTPRPDALVTETHVVTREGAPSTVVVSTEPGVTTTHTGSTTHVHSTTGTTSSSTTQASGTTSGTTSLTQPTTTTTTTTRTTETSVPMTSSVQTETTTTETRTRLRKD